jgi:hypothetical protein
MAVKRKVSEITPNRAPAHLRPKLKVYELSLKILDHIEVTPNGKLAVIFLAGTKITV